MTFPDSEEPTLAPTTPAAKNSLTAKRKPSPRWRSRAKPKVASTSRTKTLVGQRVKAVSPRPGSKAAKILRLLKRPQGTSRKELLKATNWQPHSIRGFLSGVVTKKMGLKVRSFKTESGERRYAVKV